MKDADLFVKRFGAHLRKLREKRGISQEMLAEMAEIGENQVGRIEAGSINTSLKVIYSIAKALDISVSELLTF